MKDVFSISCSSLPDTTRVAAFTAHEALSRPFECKVYLLVPTNDFESSDVIGSNAQLMIDRDDDSIPPFFFSGFFATVEILHEMEGRSLVEGIIVPRFWELGLSRHSRIFTKMSLPEIIESVFKDAGLTSDDYELRLGSYAKEEHVCQYHESDLAFVSRWMEREGIYYYFEHTDSGSKMILADDASYSEDAIGAPVTFHPQLGGGSNRGASLHTFRSRQTTLPGTVKLRDYDYAKPSLDVSGSASVGTTSLAEINVYGERFFSPGDGKRLAELRAEELLAREIVFHATGTRWHLRPGYTFELEDHPRDAFNDKYLTIGARHWGNQAAEAGALKELIELEHDHSYFVELFAIPKKTQFRPERVTPWPRIYGNENGTICGAAESEYAQIDSQGRYNVKFKFDETALKDGNASTYVRMMQPHGGGIEGFHFPLRKNTEVVFSFIGGDPDRPVIAGVVPNAHTPSPVTSGNHTKNVIQTGGRNRLEIEDQKNQQRITLSTPYSNTYVRMGSPNDGHEFILHTEDNTWFNTGHSMHLDVGIGGGSGYYQIQVKDDYKTFVKSGLYQLVVESSTWLTKVKGNSEFHTTNGHWHQFVDAGEWFTKVTGGDTTLKNVDSNTTIESVAGTMTVKSQGASRVESTASTIDLLSSAKAQLISSGDDVYIEGNKVTTKSRADHHHQILGHDFTEVNGNKQQLVMGSSRTITVGAAQSIFWGLKNTMNLSVELTNSLSDTHTTFIGGKSTITIAMQSDITIAMKFALELGTSFKLNGALATELKSAAVHQHAAHLANKATQITFAGFSLKA
jgi:type VI secretion system secreted protein VgrG